MKALRQAQTVLLDSQAVSALMRPHTDPAAAKKVTDRLNVTARRKRAGAQISVVVPTAVRVEVLWDHTSPQASGINRHPIRDFPLTTTSADKAAAIRTALGTRISVADAHVGAVLDATRTSGPHTVLTSDRPDINDITAHLGMKITIVRL